MATATITRAAIALAVCIIPDEHINRFGALAAQPGDVFEVPREIATELYDFMIEALIDRPELRGGDLIRMVNDKLFVTPLGTRVFEIIQADMAL